MKLALIVTDAWEPQVNGVVTTLKRTRAELERSATTVTVDRPPDSARMPCPTYPEIRLALLPGCVSSPHCSTVLEPDAIHIATEGPLGIPRVATVSATASRSPRRITRSFRNTLASALPISGKLVVRVLRRHHRHARRTLVATEHQRRDLVAHGFSNVVIWSRGVDAELFRPVRPRLLSRCLARSGCTRAASRWRKISTPSSRSTFPARRSSSATGRIASSSSAGIRRALSRATASAPSSRLACRPPTCSCSPAAPTRSGSSCSKPWPAARPSPRPSRSRASASPSASSAA